MTNTSHRPHFWVNCISCLCSLPKTIFLHTLNRDSRHQHKQQLEVGHQKSWLKWIFSFLMSSNRWGQPFSIFCGTPMHQNSRHSLKLDELLGFQGTKLAWNEKLSLKVSKSKKYKFIWEHFCYRYLWEQIHLPILNSKIFPTKKNLSGKLLQVLNHIPTCTCLKYIPCGPSMMDYSETSVNLRKPP